MKLEKSLILVLCALLAIVCGCGTEEPDASRDTEESVAELNTSRTTDGPIEPDADREPAGVEVESDADQSTADIEAGPKVAEETTGEEAEPPKDFTNSIGMKFKLIPAGEFMMGSRESAEELTAAFQKYESLLIASDFEDEHPRHAVRITKPFYLGSYEVTVGQFRQFVEKTSYETEGERDGEGSTGYGYNEEENKFERNPDYTWQDPGWPQTDAHPVLNVSWNDAVAFCEWLSRKEGKTYRLPTEAEWEFACRAGTTTRHHNGDDPEELVRVGNVADAAARAKLGVLTWGVSSRDGYVFTAPVGHFASNAWGLHDMHGNVSEWCSDWYDSKYYGSDYYENTPTDDPPGPSPGSLRVNRGGSWNYYPGGCRSAYRGGYTPGDRSYNLGFRVALVPAE